MKLPKISILGFVALLLVGIPLALYSVRQPTNVEEHAAEPIKPTISYLIQSSLPPGDDGVHQHDGWTFSSNKYNWWIAARNDSTTPIEFTGTLDCKSACESTTYGWPNSQNQRVTATIKPKEVMYVFVNGRTCLDVQLDFTSPGPQDGRSLVSEGCTAVTVTPTKSPTPSVAKTPTPIKTPTPTKVVTSSKCPSGTELLFAKIGTLSTNQSLALGGKVSSLTGSWAVEDQDGVLMAAHGSKMTVQFSQSVILDTVLIFDNDPKTGEKPWSINGTALTTTGNDQWAPPFKLNQKATSMVFDYGGDSPHFNICLKPESVPTVTPTKKLTPTPTVKITPTPTKKLTPTPTVKPSKTPTPSLSVTPSISPTEGPTPTIPACVIPQPVTNVHVVCPYCGAE